MPQPIPPYRPEETPYEVARAERFRLLAELREADARSVQAQFLPPAALGAWIAAGVFLAGPAHQRGILQVAPLVLVAAAALSSRISPRAEISPSARWAALAFLGGVGAALLRALHRAGAHGAGLPREVVLAGAAGGLLATMVVVHKLGQRGPELAPVIIAMITAYEATRVPTDPDLWYWGALGVFLLALGTFRLVRLAFFRWRLTALERELGVERG